MMGTKHRSRSIHGLATAIGLLVLASAMWSTPNVAAQVDAPVDPEDLGRATPEEPEVEHNAPGIPASYPLQVAPAQPFGAFRPAACEAAPYCDSYEVGVAIPEGYGEFYSLTISLEWPRDPDDNQLTLHVFTEAEDVTSGAPLGPCSTPADEACMGLNPITITLIEPDPTEPFYVTVVNVSGVNPEYTLRATFHEMELDFGDFEELGFDPTPTIAGEPSAPSPPRRTLADMFDQSDTVVDPQRAVVLVPGEDGEITEVAIPTLAAGLRPPDEGTRVNPYVTAGVLIPTLSALGLFLVARRRRSAQA
jgi:hypothetical protein